MEVEIKGSKVLIDEEYIGFVQAMKWDIDKDGYIRSNLAGKPYLHQLILPPKKGFVTDHINRNKLDNRKENLRYTTVQMNAFNKEGVNLTSQYKGVFKETVKRSYKGKEYVYEYWIAQLKQGQKAVYRERFEDEIEAAKAYDKAAMEILGDLAVLNFP